METTDKMSCNILAETLWAHGVREAVISPGSRNAPMVLALSRRGNFTTTVVIDERSAAFIALGKAAISERPVALLCTSGTSVLNYAPAIAEAFYRQIPLIVISADRPAEWIDQDDSQTLRQFEALAHYVKRSCNIPADCSSETMQWYVNRIANDALLCSLSGSRGPVHINLQLDEPLNRFAPSANGHWVTREICDAPTRKELTSDARRELAYKINSYKKVLVIAGFHNPDMRLAESLEILAQRGNIAVMTESISNIKSPTGSFIRCIDSTLSSMDEAELKEMEPELVITFGGAIVSRFIKRYLRNAPVIEHWHVSLSDITVDCMKSLTMRITMTPHDFFISIANELTTLLPADCGDYRQRWIDYGKRGVKLHSCYVAKQPWSDLTAMKSVFDSIPLGWNVQLSNGTVVRYAQLFECEGARRMDCNRGVSGIDGSTSTAVGASTAYEGITLLVTGDMSAQYDFAGLTASCVTPNFKMIVLCNGGGGIFRFIQSTSGLPELEEFFVVDRKFPIASLSEAYGFRYFEVSDETGFKKAFQEFAGERSKPCIMALFTPGKESGEILSNYFHVKH